MRSHFMVASSLAAACAATAPDCRAQVAFDNPGQPAYDDGWQPGDNGGFGFGPWSMFGTYNTPIQHVLDSTSFPNNVRVAPVSGGAARSWTLYNADAPPGPGTGTDISQAGRALLTPLQVGQTLSVIIDNPTERRFFRGYTVRFNTGGNNTTFAGTAQSRLSVGVFDYFSNGRWFAGPGSTTLFDTDTDEGMRIDVTLNSADTFSVTMTPLNNPSIAFATSGTLAGPAGSPIDWVEFELFNTDSDWYPQQTGGGFTDFYIGGMQIVPEPYPCYADCNGVGGLTIADFGCFQTKFVAGDPYADCNGTGGLTIADFGCFQTKFVAGCP